MENIKEKISTKIDELILTKKEFKESFSGMYAVSNEEYRPVLKYIHLEKDEIVCLDGYRLSIRKLNKELYGEYNLHIDDIKQIMKALKRENKEVKITFYKNKQYNVRIDNSRFRTYKYNTDKYINYKSILPYEHHNSNKITINKKELLPLFKNYRINSSNQLLKIIIDVNKKLFIENSFNDSYLNYTKNKCDDIKYTGNNDIKDNIRGLNPKFLKQVINCYGLKDNINLYLNENPYNPIIIKSDDKNKYDMVLPIRI